MFLNSSRYSLPAPPNLIESPGLRDTVLPDSSLRPLTKVPNLELQSDTTGLGDAREIEACRLLTDLSSVIFKLDSRRVV